MNLHPRLTSIATRTLAITALASIVAISPAATSPAAAQETPAVGAVYTSTNSTFGNEVAVFSRATDGTVTFERTFSTGGFGTGAALGNQGAVTLSQDNQFLFVTNAGSDDLSVFRVEKDGLTLIDLAPTGGSQPVSVAQFGDLVFVANEGNDSIRGFRLNFDGTVKAIDGAYAFLSNTASGIAQVGFGPRGRALYVTGRNANSIDVFGLNAKGIPVRQRVIDSSGNVPFGFAFGDRGQLIVSEGGGLDGLGAVTTYATSADGQLSPISASVSTTQAESCWVVTDPTNRLVFVSNTGDDTISSFFVKFDGTLVLIDVAAANTGAGPRDMAITADGQFLYVLDQAEGLVADYIVGTDGSLTGIAGSTDLLELGATGLAAR